MLNYVFSIFKFEHAYIVCIMVFGKSPDHVGGLCKHYVANVLELMMLAIL